MKGIFNYRVIYQFQDRFPGYLKRIESQRLTNEEKVKIQRFMREPTSGQLVDNALVVNLNRARYAPSGVRDYKDGIAGIEEFVKKILSDKENHLIADGMVECILNFLAERPALNDRWAANKMCAYKDVSNFVMSWETANTAIEVLKKPKGNRGGPSRFLLTFKPDPEA